MCNWLHQYISLVSDINNINYETVNLRESDKLQIETHFFWNMTLLDIYRILDTMLNGTRPQ